MSELRFLTIAPNTEYLEAKLQQKNNGIADLLQEHVELKYRTREGVEVESLPPGKCHLPLATMR